MENQPTFQEIKKKLGDKLWRLNNLYWITDKQGKRVKFKLNWAQRSFYKSMWYLNVILKARQLGFSTFIMINMLDECLFNSNVRCGVIAHTRDDAEELFNDKIKYPYENLPEEIKERRHAVQDSARKLSFNNNSSIRVGTSLRSGTLQHLHVSEYGKICRKYPEKAKEIKTGAFNTVQAGQHITVESTAEGRSGDFYDICQAAMKLKQSRAQLTQLDFKFFFYPWWKNPEYAIPPKGVQILSSTREYFEKLLKMRISLTPGQRAWYQKKKEQQGDDMKQEYPATPEEAFEASIQGAYYAEQFAAIRETGRITSVPHQKGTTVDTWWDLGMNDTMAIWFTQDVGREIHVIDYYEANGFGFDHYATILEDKSKDREFHYGRHVPPHDITVRELRGNGQNRLKSAREAGIPFEDGAPKLDIMAGIELCRKMLSICYFDEVECETGIIRLENYRKQWNDRLGTYMSTPLHDEASNGADAFRTMGVSHQFGHSHGPSQAREVKKVKPGGWT